MPSKRSNEHLSDDITARERKKQKIATARTIAVQQPTSASENAISGPAKRVQFGGMKGLPASLDVEKFAEARAFEINAMQEAMKNASSSSTQRAWQELPRHLRRRAASHDIRRVPIRLRKKAKAEMDPMRRKILGRNLPKRGKIRQEERKDRFYRRQVSKKWLETHLWHTKRMIMDNMWGYRLAVQPTEKAFRPSHRASIHGSILHDASYYGLIEIKGPEFVLKALLQCCCDPQGCTPGAQRFLTGARACDINLYQPNSYPFSLVGTVVVIWQSSGPSTSSSNADPQSGENSVESSRKRKRKRPVKGKQSVAPPEPQTSECSVSRVLWIRCHPTVFNEALVALKRATSLTLEAFKTTQGHADKSYTVEVTNLIGSVNVFEIMGPKSSQVIKGALIPNPKDERDEFKKFWASLTNLQTAGSVPHNMIIGFTVLDPRLSFPPKNARAQIDEDGLPSIPSSWTCFPTSTLARSGIWNENTRNILANVIPGTRLKATHEDNRIPVLLIQRSIGRASSTTNSSPSQHPADDPSLHGWTLIVPKGWSMAFFNSLVYTGTRVGGQRERQHQSFEAGEAYFPRDFPANAAHNTYITTRASEEQERWQRKPPAKRPNWDKLGTPSPWKPDWETALGIKSFVDGSGIDLITTQRDDPKTQQQQIQPWLFSGPDVRTIVDAASKSLNPSVAIFDGINTLRSKRQMEPLGTDLEAGILFKGALIQIRIQLLGRGSPEDLAVIYAVDDPEASKWMQVEQKKSHGWQGTEEMPGETELCEAVPPEENIIGYVTSGNYSLSRGQGFGIGAIPLAKLFELRQQSQRVRLDGLLVKIRNRDGTICRAAYIDILN
ncbi:hypothetical protein EW146_g820 [Bondarzewia mesenterica]|uniref:Pop1 N-terminal domain-containing protein n=1 Tax=Bondarzewia mesenterica TaxID=1095465 RepID=A0A4S4M676_9AGAM|nr:hypothetical protein EW146_g820 [Bondarzewia mesenterica]